MPTYEYVCERCGHRFELFQSMTAAPLTECPKDQCKQKKWEHGKVKRLIGGGAGLIFKGSGFYITDYRSDSYKSAMKKEVEAKPGSSGESKTTSGSESKATSKSAEPKPSAAPKPQKDAS